MISRRQFLRLSGLCAASAILPMTSLRGYAEELEESRAIFDESLSWVTDRSAHNVCERIKRAGFNVLVPCVWHGRGAAWPSKLAPWDSRRLEEMARDIPGFDPLEKLIDIAQQYQIEVHPWFTVMMRQREFFPQFYDAGSPGRNFDVHNQEFRTFICDLILECINRYPVQGINLDYIRSMVVCESNSCSQKYKQFSGRNLGVDRLSYGLGTAARKAITEWNEQAVSDIVQRVSSHVRKNHPNLVISVCGHVGHTNPNVEGQNILKWVDQGLIDVVYDMRYQALPNWEAIRTVQQTLKRPEAYVVLAGNFNRIGPKRVPVSREGRVVAEQITRSCQISHGNGVGLYIYSLLNNEQIEALRTGPFRNPARPKWIRAGMVPLPSPSPPTGHSLR